MQDCFLMNKYKYSETTNNAYEIIKREILSLDLGENEKLDEMLCQLEPIMPCRFEQLVQHEYDLEGVMKNIQKALDKQTSDLSSESS